MSVYDFKVRALNGESVSLKDYSGKALLIVNTASKCGLVGQLQGLEALYQEFGPDEFAVLGFPCSQFLGQEPLEGMEIQEFCSMNYDTTFPIFDKIKVNGKDADPLYKYLKEETGGGMVKWNYTKFLVDKEGQVVERFGSRTDPADVKPAIQKIM